MNVAGLTIDIEKCPDGVQRVELPAGGYDGRGGTIYHYRTLRRETERITLADLENPIVVAFVNAVEDEQRQSFFERFGLPNLTPWWHERQPKVWTFGNLNPEIHRDDIQQDQLRFRELLQNAGGNDPASAMEAVNSAFETPDAFDLKPTFHLGGPRGSPRMLLKSKSLVGFMLAATGSTVAHGARMAECEHCHSIFLTGPLTLRRSSARFCRDRCRVAANRAQRAGTSSCCILGRVPPL